MNFKTHLVLILLSLILLYSFGYIQNFHNNGISDSPTVWGSPFIVKIKGDYYCPNPVKENNYCRVDAFKTHILVLDFFIWYLLILAGFHGFKLIRKNKRKH